MKKCNKCGQEKELDKYGKWAEGKDGLCLYCKECVSKDRKDFLERNKDKIHAQRSKQRENNPERFKKSAKKCYQKYREKRIAEQREYREKNRDYINERQRKYNKRNRDLINEKSREFWSSQEGNLYANEYYHRTKEKFDLKIKARNKLRYAVKVGKMIKPETCEKCFEKRKLHGHHEDYGQPLHVIWVCDGCHAKIHHN